MEEPAEVLRFHMLETIREYAMEKLEMSGEADVFRQRHAGYFSNLAKAAEARHWLPDQIHWRDRPERERDNLHEAIRWSAIHDQERTFLELVGNLWRYWLMRGPIAEGSAWLKQAVEVCEINIGRLEKELIAWVFAGASDLARAQGDFEKALILKQRFLALCQQWGEESWAAAILNDLAIMYANDNNCERSLALAEEALSLRRKLGHPLGISHALSGMCFALMCFDRPQAAREAIEELIQISRNQQNQELLIAGLMTLIFIAARQESYEEAQYIFKELFPLAREMEDQEVIAECICGMGTLAAAQGRPRQAARLLGVADQIALTGGFRLEIPGRAWVEHTILVAKARLGEAIWTQEFQAGQKFATNSELKLEQAIAFALEESDD
jgi:tetratricopeptide (TPR) repeat protein